MPEEIFAIIVIAILTATVSGIVKQVLEYKKTRYAAQTKSDGSSLTTSELVALMRESVEQATEPLYERMTRLEELMASPPAREERNDLMRDLEGYDGEESESAAIRRKTLGRTG